MSSASPIVSYPSFCHGYDVNLLLEDDLLKQSYICQLCGCICKEAKLLECQHVVCKACLLQKSGILHECIYDHILYSTGILNQKNQQEEKIREEINELKIKCKHYKHGCEWKGIIGDYQVHLDTQCPYLDCEFHDLGCQHIRKRNEEEKVKQQHEIKKNNENKDEDENVNENKKEENKADHVEDEEGVEGVNHDFPSDSPVLIMSSSMMGTPLSLSTLSISPTLSSSSSSLYSKSHHDYHVSLLRHHLQHTINRLSHVEEKINKQSILQYDDVNMSHDDEYNHSHPTPPLSSHQPMDSIVHELNHCRRQIKLLKILNVGIWLGSVLTIGLFSYFAYRKVQNSLDMNQPNNQENPIISLFSSSTTTSSSKSTGSSPHSITIHSEDVVSRVKVAMNNGTKWLDHWWNK